MQLFAADLFTHKSPLAYDSWSLLRGFCFVLWQLAVTIRHDAAVTEPPTDQPHINTVKFYRALILSRDCDSIEV